MRELFRFPKEKKGLIVVAVEGSGRRRGRVNSTNEMIKQLEEENRKLKEDNEMLLNIVVQMKVTLNRLVNQYVTMER